MRRIEVVRAIALTMSDSREPIRVLLGSGGIATEERRELYRNLVSEHFTGCSEVVFVPFASDDHSGYTSRMQEFQGDAGPKLVGLHEFPDQIQAVSQADAIYVGGGNSFLLVKELHERGLIPAIADRVLSGAPYLGVSAGANVASPTMMTTNDMPIVHPPSFDSLGIVPFQINPHYHPGKILFMDGEALSEHYGEARSRGFPSSTGSETSQCWGCGRGHSWNGTARVAGCTVEPLRSHPEAPTDMIDGALFDKSLALEE